MINKHSSRALREYHSTETKCHLFQVGRSRHMESPNDLFWSKRGWSRLFSIFEQCKCEDYGSLSVRQIAGSNLGTIAKLCVWVELWSVTNKCVPTTNYVFRTTSVNCTCTRQRRNFLHVGGTIRSTSTARTALYDRAASSSICDWKLLSFRWERSDMHHAFNGDIDLSVIPVPTRPHKQIVALL